MQFVICLETAAVVKLLLFAHITWHYEVVATNLVVRIALCQLGLSLIEFGASHPLEKVGSVVA